MAALIVEQNILAIGLAVFPKDVDAIQLSSELELFRNHYGSNPVVYTAICNDLQTTDDPEAHVNVVNILYFLMAVHFLKVYPTELTLSSIFGVSNRTARSWTWYYLRKIQALKSSKVCLTWNHIEAAALCLLNIAYILTDSLAGPCCN